MSIFSSFFFNLKQKFFQKKQQSPHVDLSLLALVPDPLIPWEIYPDADPDTFTCLQGNESFWLNEIWYPYWESLTAEEQKKLIEQAPAQAWREWIEWRSEGAREAKSYYEKEGLNFDYRTYLEDFKMSYICDYIQKKSKKYTRQRHGLRHKFFYIIIFLASFTISYQFVRLPPSQISLRGEIFVEDSIRNGLMYLTLHTLVCFLFVKKFCDRPRFKYII